MFRTFALILLLTMPKSGAADPSQTSFAFSDVPGWVEVTSAKKALPERDSLNHWIVMPSSLNTRIVARIERMVFKGGESCERTECVNGWSVGHSVDHGEALIIMAGEEITELELYVSDGTVFKSYKTFTKPFANCRKDAKRRQQYVTGIWPHPRVAQAPFAADPKQIIVDCVR